MRPFTKVVFIGILTCVGKTLDLVPVFAGATWSFYSYFCPNKKEG
jgi:hypothetical protein